MVMCANFGEKIVRDKLVSAIFHTLPSNSSYSAFGLPDVRTIPRTCATVSEINSSLHIRHVI